MTVTEAQSLGAVEQHLAALNERFDDVPVRDDVVVNDPEFFEHGQRAAERGQLASAGAWVTDDRGRLLLVRAEGREAWAPPAGTREPDEPLVETARREAFEESGVDVRLTGVWYVRRKTIVHAAAPDRRLHMPEAWFEAAPTDDTGAPDPARTEAGEPIAEARWFAAPPDVVDDRFAERVDDWADG